MQKTNWIPKPGPHFQPVHFTVTQPSTGSFRALMIWTRASGGVTLPRHTSGLSFTAHAFVRLVRDGNTANTAAIDAVLGKGQATSRLGGDLASLKERIINFYTTLGMSRDAADLP